MIQSMKLFARYNEATNKKIHKLLEGLEPQVYTQERNTFFKSIQGLHLHILQTTKNQQSFIRTNWGGKYFVSPFTEDSFEVKPQTLAAAAGLLAEYDKNLVRFAEVLEASDLDSPKKKRTLRTGGTVLVSLSDLLTQYVVHTAHHRGQLSQLLDELGVDHDIGSTWGFVEQLTE